METKGSEVKEKGCKEKSIDKGEPEEGFCVVSYRKYLDKAKSGKPDEQGEGREKKKNKEAHGAFSRRVGHGRKRSGLGGVAISKWLSLFFVLYAEIIVLIK